MRFTARSHRFVLLSLFILLFAVAVSTANEVGSNSDRAVAELSILPGSSGPINCSETVELIFHYTPGDSILRGYEITVGCDAGLTFGEADITDLGALSDIGDQYFDITDNGDGTFKVSAALLGPTSGLVVADSLFSVVFHPVSTGVQNTSITDYKLRDLDNVQFTATVTNATVDVDCDPPNTVTLTAEPAYTAGTSNEVTWSDESGTGAILYFVELAEDVGFTVGVVDSGWIAPTNLTFNGLVDGTEYFYRVKAIDNADNETPWSNIESSTQDAVDPESSADALGIYQTVLTFDVAYTATDATSGVDSVELFYQIDAGAWTSAGSHAASPISFTAPSDGAYGFYTVATDAAGNVEVDPGAADATTIVDTTPPAGTFVINNDDSLATSTTVTLNNDITDLNPPLEMRFSTNGVDWTTWEAYAATYPWTLEPGGGPKVVHAEFKDDPQLVYATLDSIELESDAPAAPTGFAAATAHNKIAVSWTDPLDADLVSVEVWRGMWHDGSFASAYPEYDDLPGNVIPARPADRATADASADWTLVDTAAPGIEAFQDTLPNRGIYYYELFPVDDAGNYGLPVAESAVATSYWLGDVAPVEFDGFVDVADITALSTAFGTFDGDAAYDSTIDVGPTDDWSRLGIPLTDDIVDFEDLMIFAMNYSVVAPAPIMDGASEIAMLHWYQVDERTWALALLEACTDLKALVLNLDLPEGASFSHERGALLQHQSAPVFLQNDDDTKLDLSMAVMGAGSVVVGEGELFRVTFESEVSLGDPELDLRGADNLAQEFELQLDESVDVPQAYATYRNFPNPFNPSTTIRFDLPEAQHVKLAIYDTQGRRVVSLVDEILAAGYHSATWNGRDSQGSTMASGIYFYRIEAGPLTRTERMVLLK